MQKTSHTGNCLGLQIMATNLKSAVHTVSKHYAEWKGEYITFVNVHALMMTTEDVAYKKAQEEALFNFADGMPIAMYLRHHDYIQADRVAGPDFMTAILSQSSEKGFRHYLYGSDEITLEKMVYRLSQKYPDLQIVGTHAPAFSETMDEETFARLYEQDLEQINAANPDFVWVSLGAPKQELFMRYAKGKVDGLMLGVGAAFDFISENEKRAPVFMQKLGMEWLHRLIGDPKRLWKRYFVTNGKFVKMCVCERLQK